MAKSFFLNKIKTKHFRHLYNNDAVSIFVFVFENKIIFCNKIVYRNLSNHILFIFICAIYV